MTNKVFDFPLAFQKILHVIETLKKEGVEIFPALRINRFHKPGFHGPDERSYAEHFLCLALAREDGVIIFYLESASFGPKSDLHFLKTQTEKVSDDQLRKLTTEEFKGELGLYLFVPIQPGESDIRRRDMIDVRNLLFQAIDTLYGFVTSNKLVEIYNEGE